MRVWAAGVTTGQGFKSLAGDLGLGVCTRRPRPKPRPSIAPPPTQPRPQHSPAPEELEPAVEGPAEDRSVVIGGSSRLAANGLRGRLGGGARPSLKRAAVQGRCRIAVVAPGRVQEAPQVPRGRGGRGGRRAGAPGVARRILAGVRETPPPPPRLGTWRAAGPAGRRRRRLHGLGRARPRPPFLGSPPPGPLILRLPPSGGAPLTAEPQPQVSPSPSPRNPSLQSPQPLTLSPVMRPLRDRPHPYAFTLSDLHPWDLAPPPSPIPRSLSPIESRALGRGIAIT